MRGEQRQEGDGQEHADKGQPPNQGEIGVHGRERNLSGAAAQPYFSLLKTKGQKPGNSRGIWPTGRVIKALTCTVTVPQMSGKTPMRVGVP
ncbi:hypothetical protein IZ6_28220 [Terrihabitans soli]|uniref:Uncharacterized protein n=1 Tax=Terrihabitans soli TaxID=708113 RepID=A0A6S6QVX2_9HYPH|nr:hypothetical protein IZ6_28220 [Terrihabitans soli]